MSQRLRLHPGAAEHLVAAWSWYETRQTGLGDRFLVAARAAIGMAVEWPGVGSPTVHDAAGAVVERRVATAGFPYAVRYRSIHGVIVVMAVYHQHRQPDFGSDRSA